MTAFSYDYDVAVSFLSADEPLALQVRDALAPLRVFVYSKAQEEVAGTEGVETFREVFRRRAQVAIVLFRSGWGEIGWTGVEEAAIRDHCLSAGWDHLMFVRLSRDGQVPKWVPDSYIYLDFASFGLSDLVGAVKAKCAKLGIELRPPTAIDRARLIAAQESFWQATREMMRASPRPFHEAALQLFASLDEALAEIEIGTGWKIVRGHRAHLHFVARTGGISIELGARELYANTCDGAFLAFRVFAGTLLTPAEEGKFTTWDRPRLLASKELKLMRTPYCEWCWDVSGKVINAENAASMIIEEFVAARQREGGRR